MSVNHCQKAKFCHVIIVCVRVFVYICGNIGASFDERLQAAYTLLETVPLIDAHNDLPYNIRKFVHNQLSEFNFDVDLKNVPPWSNSNWSHTDLQRLKKGRVAAQVEKEINFHLSMLFTCFIYISHILLSPPLLSFIFIPELIRGQSKFQSI